MRGTPIWFGPDERPLLGWLHVPVEGKARAGVVLCPPLASERIETYATLRQLAEDLSDHQVCALRCDYDGTGDSAGNERDPERVERWLQSVAEAISLLRRAGVEDIVAIGVRFGALMAGLAAANDGDLQGLVLWDPVVSGRSYLSEQRLLAARTFNTRGRHPGEIDIPGMVIASDTAADIRSLELGRDDPRLAKRVLVLQRKGRSLETLRSRLYGPGVDWIEAEGQEDLMERGFSAGLVAHATNRAILDWLTQVCSGDLVPVHAPTPTGPAVIARTASGSPVVETAVSIGPTGLSAIVTEAPAASVSTTAVFLSGNGPCRMWVDWARQWASSGLRCVRVDLSGMGDSPVRTEGQPWWVLRAPEHFDDLADVSAHFSPSDPSDVILVGHCAAGYQALEGALSIRPRAVVALNPITHFRPPETVRGAPQDPRRRIALPLNGLTHEDRSRAHFDARQQPQGSVFIPASVYLTIRRFLSSRRARLRSVRWLPRLIGRVRTGARLRLVTLRAPSRNPSAWLRELVENDVDLLLLSGRAEARTALVGTSERLLRKLARTGHLHNYVVPDLEHATFESSRRDLLADIAADHVSLRFGPGVDRQAVEPAAFDAGAVFPRLVSPGPQPGS